MNIKKFKILTAHQPVYLPWLGLLHKISLADQFVIFDTVQYLKRDWNNRNKIKTKQGPLWLTVPVYTQDKFDQILDDVKINNTINWKKKHFMSIMMNYNKAPFFDQYIGFFEELYSKDWDQLTDLNNAILIYLLKAFKIDVEIVHGHDLSLEGSKSDLVLDMCQKLNADLYVFGSLGKDYAQVESFQQKGIEVIFQEYKHPTYKQLFEDFHPFLSALDLLFNYGDESCDVLMKDNLKKKDLMKKYRENVL